MLICKRCMVMNIPDNIGGVCPICKNKIEKQCKNDHPCRCALIIQAGKKTCPECSAFTCSCGSHDVSVVSRITGYLSNVSGWNAGKRQELEDRQRWTESPLAKEY